VTSTTSPEAVFSGAKLAVLVRSRVLVLLRDDLDHIPFPGHWDLPGGGREGDETPEACVLRELFEETGVRMEAADLTWRRHWPGALPGQTHNWFFAAERPDLRAADIRLGDEGQAWRLMPLRMFLMHPKAVPHLAARLAVYLESRQSAG
jgi:8-oxo-dGTP diphosphatase